MIEIHTPHIDAESHSSFSFSDLADTVRPYAVKLEETLRKYWVDLATAFTFEVDTGVHDGVEATEGMSGEESDAASRTMQQQKDLLKHQRLGSPEKTEATVRKSQKPVELLELKKSARSRYRRRALIVNTIFADNMRRSPLLLIGLIGSYALPESLMAKAWFLFYGLGTYMGIKALTKVHKLISHKKTVKNFKKAKHEHTARHAVINGMHADMESKFIMDAALTAWLDQLSLVPRLLITAEYMVGMPLGSWLFTKGLFFTEHWGFRLKIDSRIRLASQGEEESRSPIKTAKDYALMHGSAILQGIALGVVSLFPLLTPILTANSGGRLMMRVRPEIAENVAKFLHHPVSPELITLTGCGTCIGSALFTVAGYQITKYTGKKARYGIKKLAHRYPHIGNRFQQAQRLVNDSVHEFIRHPQTQKFITHPETKRMMAFTDAAIEVGKRQVMPRLVHMGSFLGILSRHHLKRGPHSAE